MNDFTGWVLWREFSDAEPRWQQGTLDTAGGTLSFAPSGTADRERWIIPGLVDVHSHLSIGNGDNRPLEADEARENAREEVKRGVLAIREPGSPASVDPLEGYGGPAPLVIRSGRHLARPKRYMRGLAIELENQSDLPRAVAEQAARGDGWVKLVGDWIDRSNGSDSDLDPLWDRQVLIDAVQAAHEAGARVSVHAFSRKVVDDLLAARVDSIEHGSGINREQAQEIASLGLVVTPTIVQVERFPEFAAAAGSRYPRYAQTMMGLYEDRFEWFQDLIDAGVQLLPGSDAGGFQEHGEVATEVRKWIEYGLPASDAVALATWKVRDYLGLDSLSAGAPADFVVLGQDPQVDPAALSNPLQVVQRGRVL